MKERRGAEGKRRIKRRSQRKTRKRRKRVAKIKKNVEVLKEIVSYLEGIFLISDKQEKVRS